jgi:cell division protein FtsZ
MAVTIGMPSFQPALDAQPRITVIGVGGAGGNAVNNMIASNLVGVEFIATNTDAQALAHSHAQRRLQLGGAITQGLGAGAQPQVGRAAAEESMDELMENLRGAHMVFITAGMGGGTGTGAAPIIARAAREQGILTVGVVTKPFHFEGRSRMAIAEAGIQELQQFVDTLIVIPNQNLFRVVNERTSFQDAFRLADEVLHMGVRGITDLMVREGLVNLDFNDVRSVMNEMGKAMMGTGEASGERRALDAAEAAISNPLLDDSSMKGARGVLINIMGGADLTLFEVDEAANRIRDEIDTDANIIFGAIIDPALDGRMRVTVVATGIDAVQWTGDQPAQIQVPLQPTPAPRPAAEIASPAGRPGGYGPPPAAPSVPGHMHGGGFPAGAVHAPTSSHAQPVSAMRADTTMIYPTSGATAMAAVPAAEMEPPPPAPRPTLVATAEATRNLSLRQEGDPHRGWTPTAADQADAGPYMPPPAMDPASRAAAGQTPEARRPAAQPTLARGVDGRPDPFEEAEHLNPPRQAPRSAANRLFNTATSMFGGGRTPPTKAPAEPRLRQPAAQAGLGVDPGTGATDFEGEEMAIPAFLRRQAN